MGDAGEGLVDAQDRADQRAEERERERQTPRERPPRDPEKERAIRSLQLARTELERQVQATTHPRRAEQIQLAIKDIDRRLAEL